ncbi:MAG: hypothetical protein JNL70_07050 [Saprospiraceae bacterium]|nr:hypothetical protein [Saprospiraceae bacterium]
MTSNDNATAQMLLFPYQLANSESMENCDDADIWAYQLRLWATKAITVVNEGKVSLTQELIDSLHSTNEFLREYGKPPIVFSFEK